MVRESVIRVRVTEDEKEKMREFIQNERFQSGFSDYFRSTIRADMKGELRGGAEVDTNEIVGEVADEMEPILDEVKNLNEKMSVVMESVTETEDEVVEMATEIYELLPIGQIPGYDYEYITQQRNLLSPSSDLVDVQRLSDAKSWAIYVDESDKLVQRALNYLEEFYPDVGSFTVTHYDEDGIDIDSLRRYIRTPQDGKNWLDEYGQSGGDE